MVIGATGVVGRAVVEALRPRHDVVAASRNGEHRVDVTDPASVSALLASTGDVDAVVCCAASAPLTALEDESFIANLSAKLIGQVELVRHAIPRLRDGGSVTLTSGRIPEATLGSAGGALVNAGLEAFVEAAAVELPRGLRVNAVSPGWIRESLVQLGSDPTDGIPAGAVAEVYVEAVEGGMTGQTLVARASR